MWNRSTANLISPMMIFHFNGRLSGEDKRKETVNIAHTSEIVGKYSQVIAKAALMAGGFEVAETETDESYDFVAKDPVNGRWITLQCKTIRIRSDRNNEMVVYAKKGDGQPYTKSEADMIIGVLATNGEIPRVFYFENEVKGEYWASEASASKRWVELPIAIDRTSFHKTTELELVVNG